MTRISLLLADRSPNLRLLVLSDLLHLPPDDDEVLELLAVREQDPLVKDLLSLQNNDGSWGSHTLNRDPWKGIRPTTQALIMLGYLGFDRKHPAVNIGAEFLFSLQMHDGGWPLPRSKVEDEFRDSYEMIPLQTGMPLRALAASGFATDLRSEKAYEWLLERKLSDGAWPSGVKSGKNVFPAGYRRLSHSKFGCRTNTTFVASALAFHPTRRSGPEAHQALDLLLAQETHQAHTLGFDIARTIGVERTNGFFTYFARYDVGFILDLCWRIGASFEDERVANMVTFIETLQGPYGLWEYKTHPEVSRWVSFDLLRSLSRIDKNKDWVGLVPGAKFRPYPKKPKRY